MSQYLYLYHTHAHILHVVREREGLGPVSADRTPPAIDVDDDDVSPSSHSVCNSLTQTPTGRVYTRVCNLYIYIYIYIWLTLSNGWHRHTFTSLFREKKPPPPASSVYTLIYIYIGFKVYSQSLQVHTIINILFEDNPNKRVRIAKYIYIEDKICKIFVSDRCLSHIHTHHKTL